MEQVKNSDKSIVNLFGSDKSYYEIRLESIGGLGANLCGKMLGELGVKYLDLNSQSFASYGSEKTGTPVKGYVRCCSKDKEIHVHYPVVEPDLLVIFHQALLKDETVLKGCGKETEVIIALEGDSDSFGFSMPGGLKECTVYGIPAQKIAMETHSRINVVMLGAVLKVMGMSSPWAGIQICKETLGKKYPDALEGNIQGIKRGFEELELVGKAFNQGDRSLENEASISKYVTADTKWGYKTAPIGGINPLFGSTVVSDLSPSRQGYIPLFIKDRCINCGLCHSTCPDMVFQFAKGEYKGREMMVNQGLDYYHCKGCLRCVDVCPVEALVRGIETEHPNKQYFMPNQELLRRPEYYEEAGSDGYITSESYLTEKRMEGGEV